MNKGLIFKSLAAVVSTYAIAGFFGVPYFLKNVAPAYVLEATKGGQFAVESAFFNPFTFHLTLNKLSFKTPQNSDFIALKQFSINVDPLAYLWKGAWVIGDIALSKPKMTLKRDEAGDFNFKWLTELGGDEEEKPSESLGLIIKHFALKNGTIHYRDFTQRDPYILDMGPIGFNLDNIDLRDLSTSDGKMRLYATINEGGFVDLSGKIDSLSPLIVGGSVAFDSGKLYTPWRYFKEKFPVEVADGSAAFGFDYHFDGNDVNGTELSKFYFGVDKLRIIPKGEQRNLLSLSSLRLRDGSILPMKKSFKASSLNLSGITLAAERSKEGKIDWLNYVEAIQNAFPKDENESESEPWSVALGSVAVENVGVEWTDNAPREPYQATLSNITLHTGPVSSDEKVLLNLSLATDALRVTRQSDNTLTAGLENLRVDGMEIDRVGKVAEVQKLSLRGPSIVVKRLSDGSVDLSQYVYASSSEGAQGTPWGYKIGEIDVGEGSVAFRDEVPQKKVTANFDQIHLNLKGFESNPERKTELFFTSRLNNKSTIELQSDLVRSPLRSKGSIRVKELDISLADPYIEPSTYASLRRGNLSLFADYDYKPAKTEMRGKVALHDWVVNDSRDNTVLLGWDKIGVTPFVYAYPDNRLKINQLAIDGFYTNAHIDPKKILNYSTLTKTAAKESNTTKKAVGNSFGLDIVKLLLRGSSATFSDMSLPLPFKTYIHDLEGSVLGISTTKDVTTFVKLRGGVDQYGLAKIDGSLNTKDPKKFTDVKVAFDNLELKGYTPYSLEFLGYKIDGGKLFLDLGYKIDGGKLNGANRVLIKQIELGGQKEGGSPWPLRFVVALLEDSDGVIDIDLPIEGDVNNPDFKYGKVVWQVIGNLFTKAVTSPFRLLGSMMGIESDKLSSIEFEGGSTTLLPPQVEKLDQTIAILSKRPKLAINVYGGWNEAQDVHALKAKKLVQAALKRNKDLKIDSVQAMSLEILEDMAEDSLDKKELKTLKASLREKYHEEAAYVRHYSAALVEKLIPLQPLNPQELQALGTQRAVMVRNYLVKTAGFEKRVNVKENEVIKESKAEAVPIRLEIVVP